MWDFWRFEVKGVCKKGVEVLEIVICFPNFLWVVGFGMVREASELENLKLVGFVESSSALEMISDVISGWILIADKFRHQDKTMFN